MCFALKKILRKGVCVWGRLGLPFPFSRPAADPLPPCAWEEPGVPEDTRCAFDRKVQDFIGLIQQAQAGGGAR